MIPTLRFATLALLAASCVSQSDPVARVDRTDAATLRAHVEYLSTLDPPRSYARPDGLEAAAAYIQAELESAGAEVERQWFTIDGERFSNVIARVGPDTGPVFVIGAHYDSWGNRPGADDNASGTAALVALAHEVRDMDLAMGLEFVAYTLEEPPQFGDDDMGSAHHARAIAASGVEVRGMLCLEMLGYFDDAEDTQTYPMPGMEQLYGTRADFLAVVGRAADQELIRTVHGAMQGEGLRVVSFAAPGPIEGIDLSDHRNYWEQDITAVMLTDTSYFRNDHYHTDGDTADTLDYRRMEVAVDRLRDVVRVIAGADAGAAAGGPGGAAEGGRAGE